MLNINRPTQANLELAFDRAIEKHGLTIITAPQPIKAYAFNVKGRRFVMVDSRLPRAGRSAAVRYFMEAH